MWLSFKGLNASGFNVSPRNYFKWTFPYAESGCSAAGTIFDLQRWESRVVAAAAQSQAVARLTVDFQAAAAACGSTTSSPECRTPNVSRATRLQAGESAFLVPRVARLAASAAHVAQTVWGLSSDSFHFLELAEFWICLSKLRPHCSNRDQPEGGRVSRNYWENCDAKIGTFMLYSYIPHSVLHDIFNYVWLKDCGCMCQKKEMEIWPGLYFCLFIFFKLEIDLYFCVCFIKPFLKKKKINK